MRAVRDFKVGQVTTSDATIRRAQAGDAQAFQEIYHSYHRRVWALARRWETDAERAEDLLQEAFVSVWRSLPDFRGDSALSTWIHTIVVRTALDRARAEKRREKRELSADHEGPAEVSTLPGGDIDLERAIAALPDGQRQMLLLHSVEGYRCREIAERLGVAVGTVQSQLFRAREKLKEVLDR